MKYFSGTIILTVYSGKFLVEYILWTKWIFWFFRGFAEWMFIIGVYGVFREMFTKSYSWIPFLSEIAMPFYLIHQQVLVSIVAVGPLGCHIYVRKKFSI